MVKIGSVYEIDSRNEVWLVLHEGSENMRKYEKSHS